MFPYPLYPFDPSCLTHSAYDQNGHLPKHRLRHEYLKHCYRSISGLDLLANPRVTITDIIPAIPALGMVDPQLLARVQIDGGWLPYVTLPDSLA